MKDLAELLQIQHDKSTAYHHETVGSVERSHKTLNEYLRTYIAENPKMWHTYVKYFAYCFNTTPNTAVDMYTPFELVFGKPASTLFNIGNNVNTDNNPVNSYSEFVTQQKITLINAHNRAYEFLCNNKLDYKAHYDKEAKPIQLEPGDPVLLVNEVRSKLDPLYKPNYVVDQVLGVNVVIKNLGSGQLITVHKNRVRKR